MRKTIRGGIKKVLHINQHHIKANVGDGGDRPVITTKTYQSNDYGHEAIIKDAEGHEVARIVYRGEHPLSCGARVWIETTGEVELVLRESGPEQRSEDLLCEVSV